MEDLEVVRCFEDSLCVPDFAFKVLTDIPASHFDGLNYTFNQSVTTVIRGLEPGHKYAFNLILRNLGNGIGNMKGFAEMKSIECPKAPVSTNFKPI